MTDLIPRASKTARNDPIASKTMPVRGSLSVTQRTFGWADLLTRWESGKKQPGRHNRMEAQVNNKP